MGNPKPQGLLRACKSSSRDLAGINSTNLNILLGRAPFPSCKGACLEKCQDLQTVGALQESGLDDSLPCGGSLSDHSVCVAKGFLP